MKIMLLAAVALLVIDGDTISIDGERIRIANIDAPEIRQAQCEAERRLGELARQRVSRLLQDGRVDIVRGDPANGRKIDRYGRTLAIVTVDGRDIGMALVEEGLARPWNGKRRPWCK